MDPTPPLLTVSDDAKRVLRVLTERGAFAPEQSITDAEIAAAAKVSERSVIDLAESLCDMEVAVVAWCGGSGHKGGRYIERDPTRIQAYADGLHARARAIHGRAGRYNDVVRMLQARGSRETNGQGRLFAERQTEGVPA